MSLKKLWTLSVVVALGVATAAHGQTMIPGPSFGPKGVESAENTRPLAEPGIFNYDAQMFAPVEFTNFKELKPNTGFFATYDRTYTSVSRGSARDVLPTGVTSNLIPTGADFMWGNRFELGWMTTADDGYQLIYNKTSGSYFLWGQDEQISNPMLVTSNINNFEMNRIFRQQVSNGGYFEPYIGVRYFSLNDHTLEDTVFQVAGADVGNRFKQKATNDAVGPQIGARFNNKSGRWRYTAEGALSAMYNQQRYFSTDLLFSTGATGVTEFYDSDQSFVPAADLRLELAYLVTRDMGVRLGFELNYLWDGLARTDNLTTFLNPNSTNGFGGGRTGVFDESTILAGFNFGFEWKR